MGVSGTQSNAARSFRVFLYLAGAGLLGLPAGLSVYALVLVFQPVLAPSSCVPHDPPRLFLHRQAALRLLVSAYAGKG